MRKLSWARGPNQGSERDGGDRHAPVSGRSRMNYLCSWKYADARAKLGDALPKLADVIPPANFLARTITSGILSRVRDEPSTPRGNAETTPRSPAPGKRPSKGTDSPARCKLRWNCGEIRYVYPPGGLCGASSTVTRAYDYVWIVSSSSFPPYVSFFLLIVEYAGDYAVA